MWVARQGLEEDGYRTAFHPYGFLSAHLLLCSSFISLPVFPHIPQHNGIPRTFGQGCNENNQLY